MWSFKSTTDSNPIKSEGVDEVPAAGLSDLYTPSEEEWEQAIAYNAEFNKGWESMSLAITIGHSQFVIMWLDRILTQMTSTEPLTATHVGMLARVNEFGLLPLRSSIAQHMHKLLDVHAERANPTPTLRF